MLSRIVLLIGAGLLAAIGAKYVLDPLVAAASSGLKLAAPVGQTNIRASFGAFPVACSLFIFACAPSRRMHVTGLLLLSIVIGTALMVRAYGVLLDGTFKESRTILTAESLMLSISLFAITIEYLRRQRSSAAPQHRQPRLKDKVL